MKRRLNWDALLLDRRLRELLGGSTSTKVSGESRSEYERDRDRTVYSSPIRRLIRKTQVFPLDANDLIRTRLMHSVEVSTVAEGLTTQAVRDVIKKKEKLSAEQLEAISKIAETCGLLHDLGNPPFGHAGELAIASWFECTEAGRGIFLTSAAPNARWPKTSLRLWRRKPFWVSRSDSWMEKR
jgi:dGTPase